jgi:hypothetical protein
MVGSGMNFLDDQSLPLSAILLSTILFSKFFCLNPSPPALPVASGYLML